MKSLEERIKASQTLLSPLAVPIQGALGRSTPENPDDTRFPFQRDRDRIIHSRSFRRLKGKTQVFVSGEGDHFRTRLTHTMEVAQISRDMARTLCLNEDLAECIALAHDLGHPPFGHAGEDALHEWMQQNNSSFEHNQQSLRIVTTLASRSSQCKGLNLNIEVLEGMIKHRTPHDSPQDNIPRLPSLEAQIVNIADEIAYTGHDIDDGLRAGLFTLQDLEGIALIDEARSQTMQHGTQLRGALIHMLVIDLYEETDHQLRAQHIITLDDVYERADRPVRFSEDMRNKLNVLRKFLWNNMYMHPEVLKKATEGKHIVTDLCTHYLNNPNEKIDDLHKDNGGELYESVKDYVAGMTDSFAMQSNIENLKY